MLDNIVQITPNDAASTNTISAALDPKTLQLIQRLADRPLLLEKILINESQGILLKSFLKGEKLELQLPLSTANLFKSIVANQSPAINQPQLSLSIDSKQQVKLIISQLAPQLSIGAVKSSNTNQVQVATSRPDGLPRTVSTESDSSHQPHSSSKKQLTDQPIMPLSSAKNAKNQGAEQLIFRQAKLNSRGILQLTSPVVMENQKANSSDSLRTEGSQPLLSPEGKSRHRVASPSPSPLAQSIGGSPSTEHSQKLNKSHLANVDQVVRTLLKQNFSQQMPLSNYVIQIKQNLQSLLKQDSSQPAAKLLVQQLSNLLASINRPAKPNAEAIKQRVMSSGHLLEGQIARARTILEKPISTAKIDLEQLSGKQNVLTANNNQSPVTKNLSAKPSNSPNVTNVLLESKTVNNRQALEPTANNSAVKNDLKMQLLQIKSNLESMIRALVNTVDKGSMGAKASSSTYSLNPSQNPAAIGQQTVLASTVEASRLGASGSAAEPSPTLLKRPVNQSVHNVNQSNRTEPLINANNLSLKQVNDLLSQVNGFVSQIESNQLLSLRNDQPNLVQFLVDLPFAHQSKVDSFELLFESNQQEGQPSAKKHWKVVVRFDLPPLGPMFAQVELKDERLSSNIFAESKQTAELINEHLHVLKKSLFSAGVKVDELNGSQGHIPNQLINNDERGIDTHV
jgi:hypothetical protein